MAKSKKYSYQYNLQPHGDYADQIIKWIRSQSDKNYSFKIIILKAISKYGLTTDLKPYFTDMIINGRLDQLPNLQTPSKDTSPTHLSSTTSTVTSSSTNQNPSPTSTTPNTKTNEPNKSTTPSSAAIKPAPKSAVTVKKITPDDDASETDSTPNFSFLTNH